MEMHPMKTAIIIPARFNSTRFPGKPLALLAGKTMLERVVGIGRDALQGDGSGLVVVATDDERIGAHCDDIGVDWVETAPSCATGTDRVQSAVEKLGMDFDFIVNLQGDAPLTPPDFVSAMIGSFKESPCDIVTPVVNLDWSELDKLRERKKITPFSGTCAVFNQKTGDALWFSKSIIPSIRDELQKREKEAMSPVYRHVGLYGYSRDMLRKYGELPKGYYETLEGLEQLRALENGFRIRCVSVSYSGRPSMSGVDSPEDLALAESLLRKM
jgi:3-deoxy-manno-octulosonate cytidylyltransferase (CMP-KDO synthetase)